MESYRQVCTDNLAFFAGSSVIGKLRFFNLTVWTSLNATETRNLYAEMDLTDVAINASFAEFQTGG